MSFFGNLNRRTIVMDLAIVAAVAAFIVVGIYVESRRSGDGSSNIADGVGASTAPTATAVPGASSNDPQATATSAPASTPVAQPTVPVAAGTPDPGAVGQDIFLNLSGIENESEIEASSVVVTGETTPDALVSVNGEPITVELDGTFSINIELEEGPNFIEFVSSNLRGQETSRVISVVSIQ